MKRKYPNMGMHLKKKKEKKKKKGGCVCVSFTLKKGQVGKDKLDPKHN